MSCPKFAPEKTELRYYTSSQLGLVIQIRLRSDFVGAIRLLSFEDRLSRLAEPKVGSAKRDSNSRRPDDHWLGESLNANSEADTACMKQGRGKDEADSICDSRSSFRHLCAVGVAVTNGKQTDDDYAGYKRKSDSCSDECMSLSHYRVSGCDKFYADTSRTTQSQLTASP